MFECHITIKYIAQHYRTILEPVVETEGFKLAKLFKEQGQPSELDTFMTGWDDNEMVLNARMICLCRKLGENGFQVLRYKIEEIKLDSRIADVYGLLGAKNA